MKISGIYRILNLADGKQYVGSSSNVEKRWNKHKLDLCNNKHHSQYLQNSWNKYGADSFVFELLWKCEPEECLYEEQIALNYIKCEYNTLIVAGSSLGIKRSEETRAKIGAANKTKIKIKATRDDGLIIYFNSIRDTAKSGFPHQSIWTAVRKGVKYKGFRWEKV